MPRRPVPSSAITAFIDPPRIEALLEPWIPRDADRAFVVRCILGEGPAHHRGANYVLLQLLGQVLGRRAARPRGPDDAGDIAVPIRLPPRVAQEHDDDTYPIRVPRRVLERLAPSGSATVDAMIDCVTDGPPQHALANAAMLCLLDALLSEDESAA
jgi:hypothetical protein